MKVKELIEELEKTDPEAEVILQKDAEGNGCSPCDGVQECIYAPESTWGGEVYNIDDEEVDADEQVKAVVLWPVN